MVSTAELAGALDDLDVGSVILTTTPLLGGLCSDGVEMQLTAKVKTDTEVTFKFSMAYIGVRIGSLRVVRKDGTITSEVLA